MLPDAAADSPTVTVVARHDPRHRDPLLLATPLPLPARTLRTCYPERWPVEDAFKVGKQCLGWEDVQLLAYEAVRLLARLGGWEARAKRAPGKLVLTRGLRRLLDLFATEAILADEVRQHGGLPPRIAALLGRPVTG